VQDTDGFPGNYAKLPAPVTVRADVLETITDCLTQRLRWRRLQDPPRTAPQNITLERCACRSFEKVRLRSVDGI